MTRDGEYQLRIPRGGYPNIPACLDRRPEAITEAA